MYSNTVDTVYTGSDLKHPCMLLTGVQSKEIRDTVIETNATESSVAAFFILLKTFSAYHRFVLP